MKLLTLNTHSLLEENYQQKREQFIETILKEQPDIIAMQEVNQRRDANLVPLKGLTNFAGCSCEYEKVEVREDNHALQTALSLCNAGLAYSWTWIPAKIGYEVYDEGLAVFCRKEILKVDSFFISKCRDYHNWKTRKVLGIQTENKEWFYTVHMGWWKDEEEPFELQWDCLNHALQTKKKETTVWLLGDFNSPAEFRGQGYDYIINSGWFDTYQLAVQKDHGITVEGSIDGWHSLEKLEGMRIDHIFCNKSKKIKSSNVLFDGRKEPKISDHFGVLIETATSSYEN